MNIIIFKAKDVVDLKSLYNAKNLGVVKEFSNENLQSVQDDEIVFILVDLIKVSDTLEIPVLEGLSDYFSGNYFYSLLNNLPLPRGYAISENHKVEACFEFSDVVDTTTSVRGNSYYRGFSNNFYDSLGELSALVSKFRSCLSSGIKLKILIRVLDFLTERKYITEKDKKIVVLCMELAQLGKSKC